MGRTEYHAALVEAVAETDEELMMKYHISHTMVAKYRKKAIKELDALYEERDRQTESFILR